MNHFGCTREDVYCQSDLNRIHNPALYNVRRIMNQGRLRCHCCIKTIDSNDSTSMIFRYQTETAVNDHSTIKTMYCANCLHHVGIKTCPTIRGVPAYKSVDPAIIASLRGLRP